MITSTWMCLEPDLPSILAEDPQPLRSLARGDVAAIVIRQAFGRDDCRALVERLIDEQLMFEPGDPRIDERAVPVAVSDKYLGRGTNPAESARKRIDLGASLGNYGDDPQTFFQLAAEARALFSRLFEARPDPIRTIYEHLAQLVPGKRVVTAREPDGRVYGPAIFRIHYGGYTYGPHHDSVRNREGRTSYAVHKFVSQLAGVLCIQNATRNGVSAQGVIHRQYWNADVDPHLKSGRFHEYAAEHDVQHVRVELEPGDLYFFNTGMIHEVPGVSGELPRIVLATFIGYSDDEEDVMVWS